MVRDRDRVRVEVRVSVNNNNLGAGELMDKYRRNFRGSNNLLNGFPLFQQMDGT